jgi:hypothetical protein
MNIRRGVLRLWIVGSVAWMLIVGWHAWGTYSSLAEKQLATDIYRAIATCEPRAKLPTTEVDPWEVCSRPTPAVLRVYTMQRRELIRQHLKWGLAPPAGILIVGACLGWALAGFRGTHRGNTP